jgi:hypothetical protein
MMGNQQVGEDNMFIFGAHADEVGGLRAQRVGYACDPNGDFNSSLNFK